MAKDQKDIEQIERIIIKNSDDVAVSVARALERLEERVDATETRLINRIDDLESATALDQADIAAKFDALGKHITGLVADVDGRLTELLQG